ncbi:hypothetical protein [Methylomonas sp. 11b]|uniref:hypothetical protein n=1 Tax=Methylomonas sp. 11b TaxID=1168169 RepID=UPI00047AE670|nr:hypothetical protein [Methylomonas sp. 11b]
MSISSLIDIDLPVEALALADKIRTFQKASRSGKSNTEWFYICVNCPAFNTWNKREFIGGKLSEIEFSAFVARSYVALFELKGAPYCAPTSIKKSSSYAAKLLDVLPHQTLYPDDAKNPDFLKGLTAISQWNAEEMPPYGITAKGNPVVRWLIYKLSEEFCYSFAKKPTVAIISDLVRLGWPSIENRSVMNTATDNLFIKASQQADIRRQNDNRAKTLAHQEKNSAIVAHQVLTAFRANEITQPAHSHLDKKPVVASSDESILSELEKLAKGLSDASDRRRIISSINAIKYEHGYQQDDEGN